MDVIVSFDSILYKIIFFSACSSQIIQLLGDGLLIK